MVVAVVVLVIPTEVIVAGLRTTEVDDTGTDLLTLLTLSSPNLCSAAFRYSLARVHSGIDFAFTSISTTCGFKRTDFLLPGVVVVVVVVVVVGAG